MIHCYYHIWTDGRLKINQLKQSLLLIPIIDYLLISNQIICQRRMIVKHLLHCFVIFQMVCWRQADTSPGLRYPVDQFPWRQSKKDDSNCPCYHQRLGSYSGCFRLCAPLLSTKVWTSRSCCFLSYCCCIPFLEDSHGVLLKVTKKSNKWVWTLLILRSLKEVANNSHTEGWCNSSARRHKHQRLPSEHCMEYESFVLQVLSGSSLWWSCVINGSV